MAKKDETPKGLSVEAMMVEAQKEMGADIGQLGGEYEDVERVPTGVMELDLAMGGGFPRGKASVVYGNESSCKTTVVLLAIKNMQSLHPERKSVFVGIEECPRQRARDLGVDIDKVAWIEPTTAEQVVDIVDSMCWATDVGLIAVDSLAAMMTQSQYESSSTKKTYGGAGIPIADMVRKTTAALNKNPAMPTLIYISQVRTKMGIVYGNPETFPGGNGPKFQSAMTLRLYGKNIMDTKYSKAMPVRKAVTATIQKWKVPIVAVNAQFELAMLAHGGLMPGQSDWFNTFVKYAKATGMMTKAEGKGAKGWDCFEQNWPTQESLKSVLYSDDALRAAVVSDLINALANDNSLIEAQEAAE